MTRLQQVDSPLYTIQFVRDGNGKDINISFFENGYSRFVTDIDDYSEIVKWINEKKFGLFILFVHLI
jgi:hypothetical protein